VDDSESNKKLVESFVNAVFINHDLSSLDRYMTDGYIQHNPDVPQGKAGFIEFFTMTFGAMPDFHYTVKKVVADGDQVWVYSTTSATHTSGPWLDMPPTGNKLNFDVVDMFRVENGKVAEHWDVADTLSLFSQLGKVKLP
jgi:predicted SnoaL-like aldol condensation-catalyzing enzyme